MNKILERLKKQLPLVILEFILLVVFLAHVFTDKGHFLHWRFIDQMENLAYDARVIFSSLNTSDERVVIVDIDEKSLSEIGRWPWGRDKLAKLVDQLFDHYKVELVGFDVVFAEPDESSGLHILESLARKEFKAVPEYQAKLGKLRKSLDYDQRFVDSLKDRAIILGYFFGSSVQKDQALKSGVLPKPYFSNKDFAGTDFDPPDADGYGANLPEITKNAFSAGHFNPKLDEDGVVRRVPMYYEFEDNYYESLSLAMVRKLLDNPQVELVYGFNFSFSDYNAPDWLQIGNRKIPIDKESNVLVPYRGKEGSFPYVSAVDVINGSADKEILKNKIILVGTSAQGLFDLRATPVQNAFPGVEVHANLISGILDVRVKEQPYYVQGAEFILILIIGLIMALLLPTFSPQIATIVTMALLLGSVATNFLVWQGMNLVIPIASGLIMIFLMFLLNMSYGFFVTQRGKRQIEGIFGQYVPPELVDEMSDDPSHYTLEAEVRDLTVLFSDIRSFTSISEAMNAKDLSDLLNEYLTPMTNIIQKHHGTIDKYIGDAVMAFWGAPIKHPDHAKRALAAAIEMLQVLKQMNKGFVKKGWPELKIGIGLNTGDMRVGDMGSEFRKAYTVMGDAVNLGSRLEGQTKSYGVELIVNETTKAAVPEYVYRELDRIRVKGKDEPVTIYEPIALKSKISKAEKDELKLYNQAVNYYRSQNWDNAEVQFLNLQKQNEGRFIYQLYIDRIQQFRSQPPGANWDGVFTHTTK